MKRVAVALLTVIIILGVLLSPALRTVAGQAAQGQPGGRGRGFVLGAEPMPGSAADHLSKLKLPPGFSIALYAENVAGARSMALASDGTVFVGTRAQTVHAVVDRNKDFKADEVLTVATGLTSPNGVVFRDGALYVAENSRISRYDGVLDFVKKGPAPKQTVLTDKLPTDRMHGWKYLVWGPDGMLYTAIGAPGNNLDRGDPYNTIIRLKPEAGAEFEIFARGVRNTVGYAFHPDTRELWFTENGRDALSDETPNDELNLAAKPGLHFGYPYCHQGDIVDPELGKGKSCAEYVPPVQKLGPHVAGLGMKFYNGTMFPPDYRKQLLIVNHGSWNRSPQVSHTGYRLMLAKIQNNKVTSYEPFVEGWLQAAPGSELKRQAWGQPVDLLELPDGSLLVSDDRANVIYRITYRR